MVTIIGGVIILGFVVLGIITRDGQGDFFRRISSFLYDVCCVRGWSITSSREVKKSLERLHPGQGSELLQKNYYVEKLRLMLMIVLVGTLLGILLKGKLWLEGDGRTVLELERAKAGTGHKEVTLEAVVGREKEELVIEVSEKKLTAEELEDEFRKCAVGLEQWIANKTDSNGRLSQAIELPESLEGYPFEILWRENGEGELTAYLYYGEELYCYTIFVERNSEDDETADSLEVLLRREIEAQDVKTGYTDTLTLPTRINGEEIKWREVKEDYSGGLMLLTLVTAIGVFFLKDKDLHEELQKKKRNMHMSYPVILNKFVLYMEAGLTVRGSFLKIALDAQGDTEGKEGMEAYEEMLFSCNELNAGVSESLVYEHFGKRTGLQEYTRFATMLSQNLKKGNATLLARLREESEKAQMENLQYRKKLGEEAQTKLLVPMIIMMAIVMLLVMIPAFSTFG